jgi:outer membrane protein assembly factor BamB
MLIFREDRQGEVELLTPELPGITLLIAFLPLPDRLSKEREMKTRVSPALLAFVVVLTTSGAYAQTDVAVTYQINAHHTGAIATPKLIPPLKTKWSVDLGATVSYPLIAEGKVFVIAGPDANGHVNLYALDGSTGATLWGPVKIPLGAYWWAAAAYDNGTVYVVPTDVPGLSSGELIAYSAATGNEVWTAQLPGQYSFSAPPTVGNGFVYTGGAGVGGTVYAVKQSDGTVAWTASVENGDNSSPVVTPGGVYVSYVCPQAYKFNATTGKQIWHYSGPCEGGGGATPVLYDNLLYVRDWASSYGHNGHILSAAKGLLVGNFDADFAPALANKTAFYVQAAALKAVNTTTGSTIWSAAPSNGSYSTPPIYVNGIVYVGTSSGYLLGYHWLTGKSAVSMNMGYPIAASETGSVGTPESGLGAGQSMLVVPASTHLIALEH